MIFQEIILHDFSKPLCKRLQDRKRTGPYHWRPTPPMLGRGFYMSSVPLTVARHGAGFRLRLEFANDYLRESRLSRTLSYRASSYDDDSFAPIIARLPRRRGFLAGWTMGPGMTSALEPEIHETEAEAAYAAHDAAERAAEREREYQDEERANAELEEGF